jgi:hypothetical protein
MLYGPLLVLLLHPTIVFTSPLGAGCALSFFGAFGGLLGVLRALFVHGASYFPLRKVAGHSFSSLYASYPGTLYSHGGMYLRP